MTNKIKVIAANGGGLTLQVCNGGFRYQHAYGDMTQAAHDTYAAMGGADARDWDGNEADAWLDPSDYELENDGYNSIVIDSEHAVLEWFVDTGWRNVEEFTDCLSKLLHG